MGMTRPIVIASRTGGTAPAEETGWTRPADWLALPTVTAADEKFVGLLFVADSEINFFSVIVEGDYVVSWTDNNGYSGNSGVVTGGVQFDKNFAFADVSANTELDDGMRQVIITIEPDTGASFTSLDFFNAVHPDAYLDNASNQVSPIRLKDIALAGENLASISWSGSYSQVGYGALYHLELCAIYSSALTDLTSLFYGFQHLKKATPLSFGVVTDTHSMFEMCYSLEEVGLFDTSSVTTCGAMFSTCRKLKSIPAFDTSNVTNFHTMFVYCSALESAPLLDTSSGTTFERMFEESGIRYAPVYDTTNGSNGGSKMFSSCFNLPVIPAIDLGNWTGGGTQLIDDAMYNANYMLVKYGAQNISSDLNLINTSLDRAELVSVFRELGIPVYVDNALGTEAVVGDEFTVTIDTVPFTYTATGGETISDVASALTSLINASTDYSAFNNDNNPSQTSIFAVDKINTPLATSVSTTSTELTIVIINPLTINVTGSAGVADLTAPDIAIATTKGWTVVTA